MSERKMDKMEPLNELAAALAKAQAEIQPAPKDATNPFFKSKYASLPAIREAIREVFGKYGLSVVQMPSVVGDRLVLSTLLLHESGQHLDCGELAAEVDLSNPQQLGSAITYFRRYALAAISQTVADEDDDGEAAIRPKKAAPPRPKPQPKLEPVSEKDIVDLTNAINDAADLTALKTMCNAPTTVYQRLKANGPAEDYDRVSKLAQAKNAVLKGNDNAESGRTESD